MTKKVISILLVVLIAVSAAAVSITTFTAATYNGVELDNNKLYFDTNGTGWDIADSDIVSFYIYSLERGELVGWGGKKLRGTKVEGTDSLWEYDPAYKLGDKFNPDDHYFVIFYVSDKFYETYALLFDKTCLVRVAKCDGSTCENPVDSSKTSQLAYWQGGIDPKVCGPRLAITSTGNVIGSSVEYGKTPYTIFTTFLTDTDAQGLANARHYTVDTGVKTEQKMIDDIGAGLGLTADDVQHAFTETGVATTWSYDASTLPMTAPPTQAPTAPPTQAPTMPPPPGSIPIGDSSLGDMNMNNYIDIYDATYIQKYLAYQKSLTGGEYQHAVPGSDEFFRADVDQDDRISIYDALRIRRYLAKMCKLDGSPYYD